jgi:hypothetical protein
VGAAAQRSAVHAEFRALHPQARYKLAAARSAASPRAEPALSGPLAPPPQAVRERSSQVPEPLQQQQPLELSRVPKSWAPASP